MTIEIAETGGAMRETGAETGAETATMTEIAIGGVMTKTDGNATGTIDEMTVIATTGKTTGRSRRPTTHFSRCWPIQAAALAVMTETDETVTMIVTVTTTAGTEMASLVSLNGRSRP